MQQWPVCELVLIPLTAAVGVFGLALAIMRVVMLLSGLHLGVAVFIALFVVVLIGAAATIVITLLNLPYTLRIVDLLVSMGIAVASLRLIGPVAPGVLIYTETEHLVQADTLVMLTCTSAWLFASVLTHMIKFVVPWEWLIARNPEFAQRLNEEQFGRQIYQKKLATLATSTAWQRVYRIMGILFLVLFVAAVFGSGAPIASNLPLAWAGITAVFGLLIYMALIQLAARNRLLELETWVRVQSRYSTVWLQAAFLPVVIAVILGAILPANISPLARLDGNRIGNWLGLWFYHALRNSSSNFVFGQFSLPGTLSALPAGGGSGSMGGFVMLIVYGFFITMLVIIIRSVWLLLSGERARARRMWSLLFAILTLPFRLLVHLVTTLFRRLGVLTATKRQSTARGSDANRSGKHSATGRNRRGSPSNLVLYIRYVYARMLKEAEKGGVRRWQQETALEFAQRLARSVPDTEAPAQAITDMYCNVRYAKSDPPESMRLEVLRLFRQVSQGVRRKIIRRRTLHENTR